MPPNIGELVIDFIIKSGLVHTDSVEPMLLVWSANAAEQLGEYIKRNGGGSE